jgi:soluble lytic murein transglycosylase-like protein
MRQSALRAAHRRDPFLPWPTLRGVLIVCLLSFATGWACASWSPDIRIDQPHTAVQVREAALNGWSACLREAAYASEVDPVLLQAIVAVESGEHPYAFGWNDRQGVRRLYKAPTYTAAVAKLDALLQEQTRFDIGLAQINSRNLEALGPRTGISPLLALDACMNLRLAAIILREQIRMHGPTWRAVAGYNGALTYVPKVHRNYCSRFGAGSSCRKPLPLSELLCEPIPVGETERYYPLFWGSHRL